jgi:hypothetical protein
MDVSPLAGLGELVAGIPGASSYLASASPGLRFALPWAISDTPSGLLEDDPNRAGSFPGLLFPCTILLRVD